MTDQPRVDLQVAIALPENVRLKLAQMARNQETTEAALIGRAVEGLVNAGQSPDVPRFARRLGPIAIASATQSQ